MYVTSSTFNANALSKQRYTKTRVYILPEVIEADIDGNVDITNAIDVTASLLDLKTLIEIPMEDRQMFIGKTERASIKLTFKGNIPLDNKTILVRHGVSLDDIDYEFYDMGIYEITKAVFDPKQDRMKDVEGIDRFGAFDNEVPIETFTAMLGTNLDEILTEWSLLFGASLLYDSTYASQIPVLSMEDKFYKTPLDLLRDAAKIMGKALRLIDKGFDTTIEFFGPTVLMPHVIDKAFDIDFAAPIPPITGVILSTELGDNIQTVDTSSAIEIKDIEMIKLNREDAIDMILGEVVGLSYPEMTISYPGNPNIQTLERIRVYDGRNDVWHETYSTSVEFNNRGAWSGIIRSEFQDVEVSKGNIAGTYDKTMKETAAIVDKVKGEISLIASEQSVQTEQMTELNAMLQLTSQDLQVEISNRESMGDDILAEAKAMIELEVDNFNISFSELTEKIEDGTATLAEVNAYFKFTANGLEIGKSDSPMKISIDNEQISFLQGGTPVAYINGSTLYIQQSTILDSITMANHIIEKSPFTNGRTLLRRI